jgi:hypothetical protein
LHSWKRGGLLNLLLLLLLLLLLYLLQSAVQVSC